MLQLGPRWIKIAALYLLFGIGVGIFMSSTFQLNWASAHAHVNLAGWATTAIMGVVYCIYPNAGNNTLGKWHFWLHHIGLPFFLLSTFLVQVPGMLGIAHVFTFGGAGLFGLGLIIFIVNLFINVSETASASSSKKAS